MDFDLDEIYDKIKKSLTKVGKVLQQWEKSYSGVAILAKKLI